jgi:hypothetical protein
MTARSSEFVLLNRDGGAHRIAANDAAAHVQLQPAAALQQKWPLEIDFDRFSDRQNPIGMKTDAATADVADFAASGPGRLHPVEDLECNRKSAGLAPIYGKNHAGGHGLPPLQVYVLYIIVTGFDKRNVQGFEYLPAVPVHHGLA